MEECDDADFESLLDAALGIEQPADALQGQEEKHQQQHPPRPSWWTGGVPAHSHHQHHQHHPQFLVGSPVAYDQPSPVTSPAASPLHRSTACGASPLGAGSAQQQQQQQQQQPQQQQAADGGELQHADHPGLYSPVRERRSPSAEPQSPGVPAVATATAEEVHGTGGSSQQQQQQWKQLHSHYLCFTALPREVQMRVLCLLSADALTTLAQTCAHFRSCCGEPMLWRRLFCHRWGKTKGRQQGGLSWKARYMERDLSELRAAQGNGASGEQPADAMQHMFVQAHMAKRQQALGRAAVDDLMLLEDDEVAARVVAWRKSRGFDRGPGGAEAQPQRPADLGQLARGGGGGGGGSAACGSAGGGASIASLHGCGGGVPGASRRAPVQRRRGGGGAAAAAGASGRAVGPADGTEAPLAAGGRPGGGSGNTAAAATAAAAVAAASGSSAAPAGLQWQQQQQAAAAGAAAPAGTGAAAPRRQRQRRRWTQIGNVYCDELSGWVHVCDETCSEKIVEPSSGLLVCPISGQVSDRMMNCLEEAEEDDGEDAGGKAGGDEDYGGERGRLARAFAAGYYCSDEKELLRKCGVRLSR